MSRRGRTYSLENRRIVVTGANSGIGRATAQVLVRAGAEVVLVCRNAARGSEAVEAIRRETGSDAVTLMSCDLSSQASIRDFCAGFRARYDRLDVLINNAGGYIAKRRETVDGLEMTYAVNHMGYFLMARGLLSSLQASSAARVVNVASMAHRMGFLNFDDLQWARRRFMAFRAYCDSKLMNVLFSAALANRLAGHGITVNSLHPGAIRSGFAVTERGFFGGLVRFGSFTLKSPEKGAETSIYLAGDPAVSEVTGQYFANCRRRTPSGAAQKIVAAERLWACSEGHIRIDPAL